MVFFEHHGLEEQESFRILSPSTHSFPLHFHRACEIIFVKDGELHVTIEQQTYLVTPNHAVFVFPNQLHGFHSNADTSFSIVIFSPELIGHFSTRYQGLIPVQPVFQAQQPDSTHVQTLYSQKSFLYGLCDALVNSTAFSPASYSPKIKIVQKIVAFVDTHYMEPVTLKDVAAHLQYDYAYLSKLFHQMTRLSFTEYVNQYRISQACYQLNSTEKSVSEIAMECGYQNLRTFNRNFKKVMHMTPMEYRTSGIPYGTVNLDKAEADTVK